jgi:Na+/phosphate symporter
VPLPPLKKIDLPEIAAENMTPEVTALVEFAKDMLIRRDALYAEGLALEKELAQLRRAKKRAERRRK